MAWELFAVLKGNGILSLLNRGGPQATLWAQKGEKKKSFFSLEILYFKLSYIFPSYNFLNNSECHPNLLSQTTPKELFICPI